MTMYTAQPYLNNKIGAKNFATKAEAAAYLEQYTGIEMAYEINKKLQKKLVAEGMPKAAALEAAKEYDWELIGKLYEAA